MRVLSLKPGHDGAVALIEDGRLMFSLEGEKDSYHRYSPVTPATLLTAAQMASAPPDVVAIGGWHKDIRTSTAQVGKGYFGLEGTGVTECRFFGKLVQLFSSSHERSHIFMAAGMAPGAPLKDCVVLVWEGAIGAFYRWRDYGRRLTKIPVMKRPGGRYSAFFAIVDPGFPMRGSNPRHDDAGKLMALTAFADAEGPSKPEIDMVNKLLTTEKIYPLDKQGFAGFELCNAGVRTAAVYRTARYLSDRIFDTFLRVAKEAFPDPLPLVISGGCGLNCEWNRRWAGSGVFTEVFVPPCANDSGSALGTAIDAVYQLAGPSGLEWSVYAGAPFQHDLQPDTADWSKVSLDYDAVARRLADGAVIPWLSGRCELGPRALGNRSLLAEPFRPQTRDRLNRLKEREGYRPIAPCSTAEGLTRWFEAPLADPYMLYFNRVRGHALKAVTHVDGTARVQTVERDANPPLHRLLRAFGRLTGYEVLCNTSLNFRGAGFINSMSDLVQFCTGRGLDEFVIDGQWYRRRGPFGAPESNQ